LPSSVGGGELLGAGLASVPRLRRRRAESVVQALLQCGLGASWLLVFPCAHGSLSRGSKRAVPVAADDHGAGLVNGVTAGGSLRRRGREDLVVPRTPQRTLL